MKWRHKFATSPGIFVVKGKNLVTNTTELFSGFEKTAVWSSGTRRFYAWASNFL